MTEPEPPLHFVRLVLAGEVIASGLLTLQRLADLQAELGRTPPPENAVVPPSCSKAAPLRKPPGRIPEVVEAVEVDEAAHDRYRKINPNCKLVTPHQQFESIREAAEWVGLTYQSVQKAVRANKASSSTRQWVGGVCFKALSSLRD
jgi:hypothetical protein